MSNLNFSRRNKTNLKSRSKKLHGYIFELCDKFHNIGPNKIKKNHRFNYALHFQKVILDVYSAWLTNPRLYVGYSRVDSYFREGGSYWDPIHKKAILSKDIYLKVIDFLASQKLIENHIQKPGFRLTSSRMRASKKLIAHLELLGVTGASITYENNSPLFIVKDKDKKVLSYHGAMPEHLIKSYHNLQRINQNLETTFISLNVTDTEFSKLNKLWSQEPNNEPEENDLEREPVDFTNRQLRRIFAESSFNKGGRLYGGWWQSIPSNLRKHIEINGCMTREMDYSTLQPRILYAQKGLIPEGDAYIPPGWHQDHRKLIKKAFNQIINCSPTSKPPSMWHRFAPDLEPTHYPHNWDELQPSQRKPFKREEFYKLTGRDYNELIQDLISYHEPIEDQFFSKKWADIQYTDSQIAEKVLVKLLDAPEPITALPIHDSFIVRRGGEDNLFNAMNEAFEEVLGVQCTIDFDDSVYDPPDGYTSPGIRLADHAEVRRDILSKSKYNKQYVDWVREYGPF